MTTVGAIDPAIIEQVARAIGDTSAGFTGTEIANLLRDCRIPDPGEMTKWCRRLNEALRAEQTRTQSGNCVVSLSIIRATGQREYPLGPTSTGRRAVWPAPSGMSVGGNHRSH